MRARRDHPVRADELLERLTADPEWLARGTARDRDLAEREEQSRREQATLLADLAAAGIHVSNVWDLVNTSKPYPRALPVLLAHVSRPYSDGILEGIARALAVKEARPIAWETLLAALRNGSAPKRVADGMMVALSTMARPSDLEMLIDVISDPSFGSQRVFLVANLMRSKRHIARETLGNLKDDPDLKVEIDARLKRSTKQAVQKS